MSTNFRRPFISRRVVQSNEQDNNSALAEGLSSDKAIASETLTTPLPTIPATPFWDSTVPAQPGQPYELALAPGSYPPSNRAAQFQVPLRPRLHRQSIQQGGQGKAYYGMPAEPRSCGSQQFKMLATPLPVVPETPSTGVPVTSFPGLEPIPIEPPHAWPHKSAWEAGLQNKSSP